MKREWRTSSCSWQRSAKEFAADRLASIHKMAQLGWEPWLGVRCLGQRLSEVVSCALRLERIHLLLSRVAAPKATEKSVRFQRLRLRLLEKLRTEIWTLSLKCTWLSWKRRLWWLWSMTLVTRKEKKKRNRRTTTTRWIYRSLNSVERSHAFSVTRII